MPERQLLDGVPLYQRRNCPAYLQTYRQLKKAGLCPAHSDQPDDVYLLGGNKIWLYDHSQARAYTCTTKYASAGRRSVETKRQRYTCTSCRAFHNSLTWMRQVRAGTGRCVSCRSLGRSGQ